jgi:centromere protein V
MIKHSGGCHCGRVRFEVLAPAHLDVTDCNCSMCNKTGYQHLIVPKAQFTLMQGHAELIEYTFNTGVAKHFFCSVCGIKSFYIPRSHPNSISVNVRCLDVGTISGITVKPFDGQHWEQSMADGQLR